MSELYDEASSLGTFTSKMRLFSAIIVCIILLIISIVLFATKKEYISTNALVKTALCDSVYNEKSKSSTINCTLEVEYTVDYKEYRNRLVTYDTTHNIGDKIDILYNKNDPNDISYSVFSTTIIALILLGTGVLILGGAYLNYYLSSNYKMYAAGNAAGEIIDLVK